LVSYSSTITKDIHSYDSGIYKQWWILQQIADTHTYNKVKVKINNPYICLDGSLRIQKFEAPRIYRQLAHECETVSPTHRPTLLPEDILVLISVRGCVYPMTTVWPEGLSQ